MVPDHIVSTVGFIMTIGSLIALIAIVAVWTWSTMRNQNRNSRTPVINDADSADTQ